MTTRRILSVIIRRLRLTSVALPVYQFFLKITTLIRSKEFRGSDDYFVAFASRAETPTIFVDVSSLIKMDHGGGIQRVQKSLLSAWNREAPNGYKIQPIFFSDLERCFRFVNNELAPTWESELTSSNQEKVVMSEGDVYFNTDLNYGFAIENEFFFGTLSEHRIKNIFMVYDILPLTMPSSFPPGIPQLHRQWLEIASRSGLLICISETVVSEVRAWAEESRLILEACSVRLGFDLNIKQSLNKPKKRIEKTRESLDFLVVSTIEPRKAHNQVLKAFEILWGKGLDCRLIFVGRKGWKVDNLISQIEQHELLDEKLLWLKDIEDSELADLYQTSTALINASQGEGFGLPLIEAAQHNKPIIARDLPVFKEVAGEYATYFSGDAQSLALVVQSWLLANKAGRTPDVSSMPWLTWEQSAKQLKRVLIEAIG